MLVFKSLIPLAGVIFFDSAIVADTIKLESDLGDSSDSNLISLENDNDSDSPGRENGLRNFVGEQIEQRELTPGHEHWCYNCKAGTSPCKSRDRRRNDNFHFTHCKNADMFVQCSENVNECFDMPCAQGTRWYQYPQTCCHAWDRECQSTPVNRIPGNRVPTNTCSGMGSCGGTKPCYNHSADVWPPQRKSPCWCSSDSECESCCCGSWAGGTWRVCTDSVNYGPGLRNVCMGS